MIFNKVAQKIFETLKPSKVTRPAKSINVTETSTLFITKGYSGLLKFSFDMLALWDNYAYFLPTYWSAVTFQRSYSNANEQ